MITIKNIKNDNDKIIMKVRLINMKIIILVVTKCYHSNEYFLKNGVNVGNVESHNYKKYQ